MDISLKLIVLFISILITGLSAGFFTAWSVSVIPGNLKVDDTVYLHTMQSINRAILNPVFFIIFFGSLAFLIVSTVFEFNTNRTAFYFLLSSAVVYAIGTIGITAFGNVPLNDQLDALNLASLGKEKMYEFRQMYESQWNRLHTYRTIFSVIAFGLSILALIAHSSK